MKEPTRRTTRDGADGRVTLAACALALATSIVPVATIGAAAGEPPTTTSGASKPAAPGGMSTDARAGTGRSPKVEPAAADARDEGAPRARPPEGNAPEPKGAGPARPKPAAPKPSVTSEERESQEAALTCLSRTLYWEAKHEGREGMVAVAWVVLNRTGNAEFPSTICGVVKQGSEKPGCQFSYWCDGKQDTPEDDANWALARQVAREMLTSRPPDPTGGAMFYHAVHIAKPWTAERKRTARIGRHIYYR